MSLMSVIYQPNENLRDRWMQIARCSRNEPKNSIYCISTINNKIAKNEKKCYQKDAFAGLFIHEIPAGVNRKYKHEIWLNSMGSYTFQWYNNGNRSKFAITASASGGIFSISRSY